MKRGKIIMIVLGVLFVSNLFAQYPYTTMSTGGMFEVTSNSNGYQKAGSQRVSGYDANGNLVNLEIEIQTHELLPTRYVVKKYLDKRSQNPYFSGGSGWNTCNAEVKEIVPQDPAYQYYNYKVYIFLIGWVYF